MYYEKICNIGTILAGSLYSPQPDTLFQFHLFLCFCLYVLHCKVSGILCLSSIFIFQFLTV